MLQRGSRWLPRFHYCLALLVFQMWALFVRVFRFRRITLFLAYLGKILSTL